MRRMAIFVEGQTELIFVEKLVRAIDQAGEVQVLKVEGSGGSNYNARIWIEIEINYPDPTKNKQILVADCTGDSRVVSDIIDQSEGLKEVGFEAIVGLRDLSPDFERLEEDEAKQAMADNLQRSSLPSQIIMAVMEIEAWFLAEHTHFPRIHESLTCELIQATLGFNPELQDMQDRDEPVSDLNNVYSIAGMRYRKNRQRVERTVNALDLAGFYSGHGKNYAPFIEFASHIRNFIIN
jgi:hypothetical protein